MCQNFSSKGCPLSTWHVTCLYCMPQLQLVSVALFHQLTMACLKWILTFHTSRGKEKCWCNFNLHLIFKCNFKWSSLKQKEKKLYLYKMYLCNTLKQPEVLNAACWFQKFCSLGWHYLYGMYGNYGVEFPWKQSFPQDFWHFGFSPPLEILWGQSGLLYLSFPQLNWKPRAGSLIYVNRKNSRETNREESREILSPKL